ncbi:hypothetical protein [Nocardia callitridis]|uniref:Uncharacterized protein n=1 Tax=Nocardia callitridis TaxID=648753 RepID=A0ABP9JT77_9NOCA
MHLTVVLAPGVRLDYAACRTAAFRFVKEWRIYECHRHVTVVPGDPDGLPRLPNERLYLYP